MRGGDSARCPDRDPAHNQAKDPALFLQSNRTQRKWDEPAEPAKIAGPIHFGGTKGLGMFLIAGSEGHILLYTGMPGSGPMIDAADAGPHPRLDDLRHEHPDCSRSDAKGGSGGRRGGKDLDLDPRNAFDVDVTSAGPRDASYCLTDAPGRRT
jgi:hypothetical protein